jgi:hypothetical protein
MTLNNLEVTKCWLHKYYVFVYFLLFSSIFYIFYFYFRINFGRPSMVLRYSCTMVVLGKEGVTGDMRLYYKVPSIMDWTLVHGRFPRVSSSSNVDTLDVLKNMHATIQLAIFLFILQLSLRFFFSLNPNYVLISSYQITCPIVYYTQCA